MRVSELRRIAVEVGTDAMVVEEALNHDDGVLVVCLAQLHPEEQGF